LSGVTRAIVPSLIFILRVSYALLSKQLTFRRVSIISLFESADKEYLALTYNLVYDLYTKVHAQFQLPGNQVGYSCNRKLHV